MKQSQGNGRVSGHVFKVERKRGAQWYAKYRLLDGRQVQKRLGAVWAGKGRPPAGYFTDKMAQEQLEAILTDARRGALPGHRRTGATFADAGAEYLRYIELKGIDAKTLRDYRGVIERKLHPEFGSRPLETITADDIDHWKEKVLDEGNVSNRVIVRYLTIMHGVFKRAKRVYGLAENPASADLVERPKVVYTGEFTTYDRNELELLFDAAESEQERALYAVAAFTGLRQGELLALRWGDVDFVAGLLHVRRNFTDGAEKVPKGKKVRSVPMTPDVVDALARLKERGYLAEDGDLVFVAEDGEHLGHFNVRRAFYRAIDRAGLRRIRFHDLRHHFGSGAITVLDAYSVQAYMGHAHYSTTQRYLHHKPRPADAAALHGAFGGKTTIPAEPEKESAEA